MDKESATELQKIDCNCNNCYWLFRDNDKLTVSHKFHHDLQLNEFTNRKERLSRIVDEYYRKGEFEKGFSVEQEHNTMRFQFEKKQILLRYGHCAKIEFPVSFIPDICQLETQGCFKHRND